MRFLSNNIFPDINFAIWERLERLEKQLARGDQGINSLDAACREHGIAYSYDNDLAERQADDNILADKARKCRWFDSQRERVIAIAIWTALKAKTKIGFENKEEEEQADTSDSETRRRPACSIVTRHSRVIAR